MSESKPQMENEAVTRGYPDWDVQPVVEQIWSDLGGTVARQAIRLELAHVIPSFERVPIQTFVPIFVRRRTVERLPNGSSGVPEKEPAAAGAPEQRLETVRVPGRTTAGNLGRKAGQRT